MDSGGGQGRRLVQDLNWMQPQPWHQHWNGGQEFQPGDSQFRAMAAYIQNLERQNLISVGRIRNQNFMIFALLFIIIGLVLTMITAHALPILLLLMFVCLVFFSRRA